jgi:hypothetical protein
MTINFGWSPIDVIKTTDDEPQSWNGLYYIDRDRTKTGTRMLAVIPPEVKALIDKVGRFDFEKWYIHDTFESVAKEYNVKIVTARMARKWVKVHCRKIGLSKPASSLLMGHESSSDMQDWYDKPPIEEILTEQAQVIPNGVLGTLLTPRAEIIEDDEEAVAVWRDYREGRIGTMEMAMRLEQLKTTQGLKREIHT